MISSSQCPRFPTQINRTFLLLNSFGLIDHHHKIMFPYLNRLISLEDKDVANSIGEIFSLRSTFLCWNGENVLGRSSSCLDIPGTKQPPMLMITTTTNVEGTKPEI